MPGLHSRPVLGTGGFPGHINTALWPVTEKTVAFSVWGQGQEPRVTGQSLAHSFFPLCTPRRKRKENSRLVCQRRRVSGRGKEATIGQYFINSMTSTKVTTIWEPPAPQQSPQHLSSSSGLQTGSRLQAQK